MKRFNRTFYIAISSFTLVFFFQNCSKTNFGDSTKEEVLSSLGDSSISINYNATYTNRSNVMVQIGMPNSADMYVTNSPDCLSGGSWQAYTNEIPWTLSQNNRAVSVYVKFRSQYGSETDCISDSIVHDDILPLAGLALPVSAKTNSASTSIKINATDSGSGIDKILCSSGVSNCSADMSIANSAEGPQSFTFYAVDKAGNQSLPLSVNWLVDKTGPVVSFNPAPANKTNKAEVEFKVSAVDNYTPSSNITFKQSFNGAALATVNSTFKVTAVAEGEQQITVYAYDDVGNQSAPITFKWQYGAKNPELKLTKTPDLYTNVKAGFEFEGKDQFGDALKKYECSVNNSAYTLCSSPFSLDAVNLNQGKNNFTVKGTDNYDQFIEVSHEWNYDTVKPVIEDFIRKPAKFSKNKDETAEVKVIEAVLIDTISFYIDDSLASPAASASTAYTFLNLTEAKHVIKVVAKDKAGNVSDPKTYDFWSDFTKPSIDEILITSPTANKDIDVPIIAKDNNTDPANILSVSYNLDDAANYSVLASSPLQLRNLLSGNHKLKVYAVDQAGNKSEEVMANPNTGYFMVDRDLPIITFNKVPSSSVNVGENSKVTINFNVIDVHSGLKVYGCGISVTPGQETPESINCQNDTDIILTMSEAGIYTFSVKAEDNVGNIATKSITWRAAQQYQQYEKLFRVDSLNNELVDILFVVDNSKSMAEEQQRLASALSNLINNLGGLNWRIGITNCDSQGSGPGANGSLIEYKDASGNGTGKFYIDSNTANAAALFQKTIETGIKWNSDSVRELCLTAVQDFIGRVQSPPKNGAPSNPNEKGFFRSDAVFATIGITDTDESRYSSGYASADNYLYGSQDNPTSGLYDKLPGKTYIHHSAIVLPNDHTCAAQAGGFPGLTYDAVSKATDGISTSICKSDYGNDLKDFATSIIIKVSEETLACAPVDSDNNGSLNIAVTYNPDSAPSTTVTVASSQYSVLDKVVRFTTPQTVIGNYKISYTCLAP